MGKTKREVHRPRRYFVTWLSKSGKIETTSFSTLYEAKRFAGNLDTAGCRIH